MLKREEGFFKGFDNTNLFFQVWDNPNAKGTIIVTHGHGEHSECYHRLFEAFKDDQWSFYAWDLRGHGRSEGRRGYATHFDDYCKDHKIFVEKVLSIEKVKKGPVILFSHSMGGLIELKTLMHNSDLPHDALVVSAPLLGLSMEVPLVKSSAAFLLNKLVPQLTLGNEINNKSLTSDPEVIREYENDSLRHVKMSPGVFVGMLESWEYCRPRAGEIKKPTLFILPEKDPVCSTAEAMSFYDRLGSKRKELKIYPNAKHEIINDVMRNTAFADIKRFLDSILESRS
ncbi:lysophospholipase [Bdellovibrio sp. SKB1291214]|uniref:alpha/beta hydrolase n=1 Tax=Bdellovibrio sp. SKB1291214 TaxID=1732569 RepID=UPI000B51DA7E|nr:alpha/beta hydrolase [Bdellovibrio sp. SKB1291214]UYL08812.1 lysophospholipase [Bdellovibrio sp. SKB1291214]